MCVDFDTRQRHVNVSRLFVSAVKITCWLIIVFIYEVLPYHTLHV